MKKAAFVTGVGVLVAVITAYSAEADLPGRSWVKSGAAANLNLTDEQLDALDKESYGHRAKSVELGARLKQKRNEVRYLLDQEKIDRKAVLRASEETAAVETEMLENRIDRKLAMRDVLSPLQQEKAGEMLSRRPERAGEKGPRRQAGERREKGKKFFKGEGAGTWWENPQVAGDLGLTEDQSTQLRDSFYKLGQERIGLAAQKEIKKMALKRAMDAAEVDRPEVDGLVGGIGEIETALAKNRAEAMISEREILKADQIEKLKAIKMEEAKERRGFLREHALGREGGRKRRHEKTRGPGRSECPGDEA